MTDKRKLENILTDQAEELSAKSAERFCRRREEDMIELDSPLAQVVIGVRRSGKSTLCYNALRRSGVKYAYVNFDDERLARLTGDDLNDVLEVLYKTVGDFTHLFIDEIQNIPEWYLFVNRLLRRGLRVVITGSNAKLLSGELATHLTGRHHAVTLLPFSFAEYCDIRSIDTRSATTRAVARRRAAFDDYLRQGGFPELRSVSDSRAYIDSLVGSILRRDIEQRFRMAYAAAFEQMAQHLLNTAPAIIVEKTLCRAFGFGSENTVKNYISYLRQAYLIIGLHRYTAKSRQRMTGEKAYPVDVALMNKRADAFAGENLGWRLETVVLHELLRRYRRQGCDVYYVRERGGECDFVVCDGNVARLAVQVSYDISSPHTRRRELAGLSLAARHCGATRLLLLTDHQHEDITHEGRAVAIRPVYDWLLSLGDESIR